MSRWIPVNEPLLGELEVQYVTDCVRSGWISSAGRYLNEFEQGWAAYCGRKHGIAVGNGTVALQLAVRALNLKEGDEVILPSFTIVSCALAVLYSGAVPVLVDSDPETWCMDADAVESRITSRTRAIMPVHIYGHPVNMRPLLDLADKHNLVLIEDAAEAHGAEYLDQNTWRKCGSFGAVSCFSFYANKLITTGEGGMLLTDDSELAAQLQSLRNLCFLPERRFYHEDLGFNFRMTNIQAALGVAQLQRMDEIIARKRWIGHEYTRRLQGVGGLQLPVEKPWAKSVFWMYGVVLPDECDVTAVELARRMKERGVETRPFFLGMHEQPAFHERGLFGGESYPVTERLARKGLYLPSGIALSEEQLAYVCDTLSEVLQ